MPLKPKDNTEALFSSCAQSDFHSLISSPSTASPLHCPLHVFSMKELYNMNCFVSTKFGQLVIFPKLESTYIFLSKENEVQMQNLIWIHSPVLYTIKEEGRHRDSGTPEG